MQHALFDYVPLMQLIVAFLPDDTKTWLQDSSSELHRRLLSWQNVQCKEAFVYACQKGNVSRLKTYLTIENAESMETWHLKTWRFFQQYRLDCLQSFETFVYLLQWTKNYQELEEVLPFFNMESATIETQQKFLHVLVAKLPLEAFQRQFAKLKASSLQILNCFLGFLPKSYANDYKFVKPTIKWMVEQISFHKDQNEWRAFTEQCSEQLIDKFNGMHYVLFKSLLRSGQLDSQLQNELFHSLICNIRGGNYSSLCSKLILLLWQPSIFLGNYMTPYLTNDNPRWKFSDWNKFHVYNLEAKLFVPTATVDSSSSDSEHQSAQSSRRKRKRASQKMPSLSQQINNLWIPLSEDADAGDMVLDSEEYFDSDPGDFVNNISDTDSEDDSNYCSTEFEGSDFYWGPSSVEIAIRNLQDIVYNNINSNLGVAFMAQLIDFVFEWTPVQYCAAFTNACQGQRFSLVRMLWMLAPQSLHASLSEHLCVALKGENREFMDFAWTHASLAYCAPFAAEIALQYRNLTLWQFLFDKNLLTEDLLLDDKCKFWSKLCLVPADFLRLVWKDTPLWRSKFDQMIKVALKANKRWVVMFLSKQNIPLDQMWLRDSIMKLTILNLPHVLSQIHDPKTLDLEDVLECYSHLLQHEYFRINSTWWNMYPLTREQLLTIPDFKWENVSFKLMQHLWQDGVANSEDLCAYARKNHPLLECFDLDLSTVSLLRAQGINF